MPERPRRPSCVDGAGDLARAEHARERRAVELDQLEHLVVVGLARRRPPAVPEASPRSVTPAPLSRSVMKSCGSRTCATRAASSGSTRRSHIQEVAVKDATGTLPSRSAAGRRAAEQLDEALGVGRRARVVPERGGTQGGAVRCRARRGRAAGRRRRSRQRRPRARSQRAPRRGRATTPRDRSRARRPHPSPRADACPCATMRPALGIDQHDFGRLRGAVDTGYEGGHGRVVWSRTMEATRRSS